MATHQIGKIKYRVSRNGLEYKIGDGEKKWLFKLKKEPQDGYYPEQGDDSDYAYDEGYYYDEPAGDQAYEQGYDEDGYYYDEAQQDSGEGYYDEEPRGGKIMDFIDRNFWLTIILLFIFPPIGIYLLWRANRFDRIVQIAISAASAVWLVVALILLFMGIFSGGDDPQTQQGMTLTSIVPATATPTASPSIEPTATVSAIDSIIAGATPKATPINNPSTGNVTGNGTADSGNVYSPQTGLYYHKSANCSKIGANVSVSLVTLEAAQNRNQSACPLCCGGVVYYATASGSRYHTDRNCDGMQNAVEYSKEAAEREGKVACYICAGGKAPTTEVDNKNKIQQYAASITNDKSGLKVYMNSGGDYYHAGPTCTRMDSAGEVTLLRALQAGKSACPSCLSYLNTYVYATSSGRYYHSAATTCGMKNGTRVTLSAALVLGKKKCPDCIDSSIYTNKTEEDKTTTSGEVMVYATANGSYYHTDSTCDGMKNANRVSLTAALKAGRPACPKCCPSAEKTVYASSDSKYYHSYAGCSNMSDPKSGTLAQALALKLTACPKCWSSDGDAVTNADKIDPEDGNTGYSGIFVYAAESGSRYHAINNCSKIEADAVKVLLELAIDDGKKPCSTCADFADDKVYGAVGNKYFHKTSSCSGIVNAKSGTIADALLVGLKACPLCFDENDMPAQNVSGSTTPGATVSNKYTAGKSGVDVYATYEGKYYHTNTLCSGINGIPIEVSLETALNNSKSACPVCASSANRTVYGTTNGRYYHYSSSCAGAFATSAHLDTALALGFKPCPNCVTGSGSIQTPTVAPTPIPEKYIEGVSGIKVYAVSNERYYHTERHCGGMTNAQYVALEKVMNLGYKACPLCTAVGNYTVYCFEIDPTSFHIRKDCHDGDYYAGSLDAALAYGLIPCPICITGEGGFVEGGDNNVFPDIDEGDIPGGDDNVDDFVPGGEDYSAPADTRVYIDLSGKSSYFLYHTGKKCADSGMTDGTSVTLQYALDHGYSDCGYCNPPTKVN